MAFVAGRNYEVCVGQRAGCRGRDDRVGAGTHRRHFSRKYYNSPMPHSIFFHYGFAIHGIKLSDPIGVVATVGKEH
jgi:hypothetical protein